MIVIDLGATWIRGAGFNPGLEVIYELRTAVRDSIQGKADENFVRSRELAKEISQWVHAQGLELIVGCIAVPE